MRTVQILAVGRVRDRHVRALCDDFYQRCRSHMRIEECEFRDDKQLAAAVASGGWTVALDPRGKALDTPTFASSLMTWIRESKKISFVIGGHDGLTDAVRGSADRVLSFGPMVLGHRIARIVLAEQLYRAICVVSGLPYHRHT